MTAFIIDGKQMAAEIRLSLATRIQRRLDSDLRAPGLAVIQVGNHSASQVYVKNKRRACEKVGIQSSAYDLPEETSQEELLKLIDTLNADETIDGILVQLPLPDHIDNQWVIERILPDKDVDGFHPHNLGRLLQRAPLFRPCTPYGIITLLDGINYDLKGKHAVVVGVSNIVGRPMVMELLLAKATVTACHRFTKDLAYFVKQADVLVVAVGKPGIVKTQWIKPGAAVIDVGINRQEDGTLVGDIDFETAKERAGWITPVPGGVGPMTIAMLLENTYFAAENLHSPEIT